MFRIRIFSAAFLAIACGSLGAQSTAMPADMHHDHAVATACRPPLRRTARCPRTRREPPRGSRHRRGIASM